MAAHASAAKVPVDLHQLYASGDDSFLLFVGGVVDLKLRWMDQAEREWKAKHG